MASIRNFISLHSLGMVRDLIINKDVEACGTIIARSDGPSNFIPFIEAYGESDKNRGMCQNKSYSRYIWHTHPRNLIAYPSGEDYVKMIKGGKGRPHTSFVFTNWGVWEIYSKNKVDNLRQSSIVRLLTGIKEQEGGLYHISGKGRGETINPMFIAPYVKGVISVIESEFPGIGFNISFLPWNQIRSGNGYVIRYP